MELTGTVEDVIYKNESNVLKFSTESDLKP